MHWVLLLLQAAISPLFSDLSKEERNGFAGKLTNVPSRPPPSRPRRRSLLAEDPKEYIDWSTSEYASNGFVLLLNPSRSKARCQGTMTKVLSIFFVTICHTERRRVQYLMSSCWCTRGRWSSWEPRWVRCPTNKKKRKTCDCMTGQTGMANNAGMMV